MPHPTAPRLLDQLPLFLGLSPEARRTIATAGVLRRFEAGETLWTAGADPRGLFVILAGHVRVVRAPAGRQYTVHTEGPGGTLGDVPFFAGGRYPATALAITRTTCLALDRDTIARVVAMDPEFAFRLLGRLAGRVRGLVQRLDERTGRTVERRLAVLLLERHTASGGGPFTLGATQAVAAEEIGTVREVLVRTLGELRRAGLVGTVARGHYRALDVAGLKRLAGE